MKVSKTKNYGVDNATVLSTPSQKKYNDKVRAYAARGKRFMETCRNGNGKVSTRVWNGAYKYLKWLEYYNKGVRGNKLPYNKMLPSTR
jgi:hypothetical protein